jgi:RNA ligase
MFPRIEHINDILPYVKNKKNIIIKDNGNGTISINYTTITDNKLFNCHYARECRGITFWNDTGYIAIRPFQKFFNIGERTETLPEKLDWNNILSITEKIDGSICTTMVINDNVVAKSMSSFDSVHAQRMTQYINKNANLVKFCKRVWDMGYTPIFEYVAPEFQIVIPYEKEELILLAVREMMSGDYISQHNILGLFANCGIKETDMNIITSEHAGFQDYNNLKDMLTRLKNSEGYVIHFNSGQMVKAKTLWYVQLHRCKAQLSEKNVAESCLTGDIDDIKGMMITMGLDITIVNEIDIIVQRGLNSLIEQTEKLFRLYDFEKDDSGKTILRSRKQFAMKYKHEKCFSLVMRLVDGKKVDYINFYRKRILPNKFNNDSVLN